MTRAASSATASSAPTKMTATAAPRPRWVRRASHSTAGLSASARNSATRIHVITVRATHTTSSAAANATATPSTVRTVRGRRETMRSGTIRRYCSRATATKPADGARARSPSGAAGDLLAGLLRVLLAGLLGGLGGLLRRLLAVLDGDLRGLLRLLLDLVGGGADLPVLDPADRDEQPADEADGDRADGEPERVLLRDAL